MCDDFEREKREPPDLVFQMIFHWFTGVPLCVTPFIKPRFIMKGSRGCHLSERAPVCLLWNSGKQTKSQRAHWDTCKWTQNSHKFSHFINTKFDVFRWGPPGYEPQTHLIHSQLLASSLFYSVTKRAWSPTFWQLVFSFLTFNNFEIYISRERLLKWRGKNERLQLSIF